MHINPTDGHIQSTFRVYILPLISKTVVFLSIQMGIHDWALFDTVIRPDDDLQQD